MADTIAVVMTPRPLTISPDAPVAEAASAMRDADVGDVLVVRGRDLIGIVTDRDIVVRVVADGRDPQATTVGEISSEKVMAVSPDDDRTRCAGSRSSRVASRSGSSRSATLPSRRTASRPSLTSAPPRRTSDAGRAHEWAR